MILVLSLGCGLGWAVRQAESQREAVAAIEAADGFVWYDWEWKDGKPLPNAARRRPGWLAKQIGVDFFHHVVSVWLSDRSLDLVLPHVGRLNQVEELEFETSSTDHGRLVVGDAALFHLRGLSRLQSLDLSTSFVSDAGLVHLKGLAGLRTLDLSDTEVSDTGLIHLQGMTGLQRLDLRSTRVDDFGVWELRHALPKLKVAYYGLQAR